MTEYKGFGSGTHDNSCNPPFVYNGTYQMSQIEARHCAQGGRTWQWVINHYYDYNGATGWEIRDGYRPEKPSVSTASRSGGKVRISWSSLGAWKSKVQRFSSRIDGGVWLRVFAGGWRKSCRCINMVTTDTGLQSGASYRTESLQAI